MQYDKSGEGQPITAGWVARVWDKAIRDRYKLLIQKLAAKFDGKIYSANEVIMHGSGTNTIVR